MSFARQATETLLLETKAFPTTWDDVFVGYELGLMTAEELRAWAHSSELTAPWRRELDHISDLSDLENVLRRICIRAGGCPPRPQDARWLSARNRWRESLLAHALESPTDPEALAVAVETIYFCVGCPQDMRDLWSRSHPAEGRPAMASRDRVEAFLRHRRSDARA